MGSSSRYEPVTDFENSIAIADMHLSYDPTLVHSEGVDGVAVRHPREGVYLDRVVTETNREQITQVVDRDMLYDGRKSSFGNGLPIDDSRVIQLPDGFER